MGIRIKDGMNAFRKMNDEMVDLVLNGMAIDIERMAKLVVPVGINQRKIKSGKNKGQFAKTGGPLRASIKHYKKKEKAYFIIANKEYAAYQEFGGDGRRIVRNYSKVGTGKEYLSGPGKKIGADFGRRFTAIMSRRTLTSLGVDLDLGNFGN